MRKMFTSRDGQSGVERINKNYRKNQYSCRRICMDEKITYFAKMAQLEELFLQESEIIEEAMFEFLMKALQKKDDLENRNYWKNTTKDTIFKFLNDVECLKNALKA